MSKDEIIIGEYGTPSGKQQDFQEYTPLPEDNVNIDRTYLIRRELTPNADVRAIMAQMTPEKSPYSEPYRIDQNATPEQGISKALKEDKKAGYVESQKRQGVSNEEIKTGMAGGETDPWFSPIDVLIPSGYMGYFGSRVAGLGMRKASERAAAAAITSTLADAPIGTATEAVGERFPKLALPFNLLFGVASGVSAERIVEDAIIDTTKKLSRKMPTLKEIKTLSTDFVKRAQSGDIDEWINDGLFRSVADSPVSKEAQMVAKTAEERGSLSMQPSEMMGEVAATVHQKLEQEISDRITKALKLSREPLVSVRPKVADIPEASEAEAASFMRTDRANLELPDRAININFSKIESPDDIKAAINSTAIEYDAGIQTARRGKIKNEETERLASDLGMTVDQLLARRRGEAFNAEQALAARKINLASATRLRELAVQAADPLASEEIKFAFRKHLNTHYAIQAQVSGMTAEAGRALNQFKIKVDSTEGMIIQMKDAMSRLGSAETDADATRIANMIATLDDPGKLTKAVRKMQNPGALGMLRELWLNTILSGPITHTKNMLSNTLVALTQPIERGTASAIGHALEPFGGGRAQIGAGEVAGQIIGMKMAFTDAFRLIGEIGRIGYQQGGREAINRLATALSDQEGKIEYKPAITGANMMESPLGKLADKVGAGGMLSRGTDLLGELVRIPGTALGIEDTLFKGIGYRMELWAQAYRRAESEGLSGSNMAARIQQIVDDPPADIHHLATQNADYTTFTKKLGESGQALQRVAALPGAFFILPFVKTPVNIFKYFGERTPLALLSKSVREDITAGGATRDLALAKMSLGSMVAATFGWWAMEGNVTGSGPKNPDAMATWKRTGWQPYSVKVNDTYYSFGGLEPLGTIAGIAADVGECIREYQVGHYRSDDVEDEIEKAVYAAGSAVMKNMTSKTFLQGVSQAIEAMYDPDRFLKVYAKSMAKSFVPNVVQQVNRTELDPVVRDARDIVDALKSAIPGLSKTLPPRRNLWGEVIEREGGGTPGLPDVLDPIYKSTDRKSNIDDEMKRLNMKIGMPDRFMEGVELTPDEYDRYVQLIGNEMKYNGAGLKDTLTRMLDNPTYQQMSDEQDGGKVKMIKEMHGNFKEAAKAQMMREFPDLYQALIEHKRAKARKLSPQSGAPVF